MDRSAPGPHFIERGGRTLLNLTLAMTEYEHTRDLTNGLVQPQGIALTPLTLPVEQIFHRYLGNFEFDVAEASFAKYSSMVTGGDSPLVGIPVFPSRVFRHSALYVRSDSGIASPKDLEGRRVGVPEWAQTAGVYFRGVLSEYYDVALDRIHWVQAGVNQPGRAEKARLSLPPSIHYESRPDSSLTEMLRSGEIDAALTARPPDNFVQGEAGIVRLFPDYRVAEEAYFEATAIFPIMHVITIRRALFEAHPWIAMNLQTAFEAAKDAAVERLRDIAVSRVPLPWGAAIAEEMSRRFSDDFWPYGVDRNRPTLEAFCRFAHQQHITPRLLTVDDLFPREVRATAKV
jgi:4,5-dihydroxyphthalate decarboxylase